MATHLGEAISQTLEKAYEHMDPKTGMFPADWTCKVCHKRLNADGMHPAELYAGTYSGLCYACERGGPYVVPGSELPDGAFRVSHPPASPSWRRDRTEHWAYPDCPDCKGLGAKMRHTAMNQYLEFCRPCLARVMVKRKANEVEFLNWMATHLEEATLYEASDNPPLTATQWAVAGAANQVAKYLLDRYAEEPLVWRPQRYLLQEAESKLTKAQMNAKRPDTLRRHLVAALRARADEIASTSTS